MTDEQKTEISALATKFETLRRANQSALEAVVAKQPYLDDGERVKDMVAIHVTEAELSDLEGQVIAFKTKMRQQHASV